NQPGCDDGRGSAEKCNGGIEAEGKPLWRTLIGKISERKPGNVPSSTVTGAPKATWVAPKAVQALRAALELRRCQKFGHIRPCRGAQAHGRAPHRCLGLDAKQSQNSVSNASGHAQNS